MEQMVMVGWSKPEMEVNPLWKYINLAFLLLTTRWRQALPNTVPSLPSLERELKKCHPLQCRAAVLDPGKEKRWYSGETFSNCTEVAGQCFGSRKGPQYGAEWWFIRLPGSRGCAKGLQGLSAWKTALVQWKAQLKSMQLNEAGWHNTPEPNRQLACIRAAKAEKERGENSTETWLSNPNQDV